jgi:hypothetical protein
VAAITEVLVRISDIGAGANPEAMVTVMVGEKEVKHVISGVEAFGLTGAQVTSLNNTLALLRTRTIAITKADFTIP